MPPSEQAEEALRATQRELAATLVRMEEYRKAINHDLRSTLQVIAGFLELLHMQSQDRLDETGLRHLDRARAGARRLEAQLDALHVLAASGGDG
jgi:light-regulated signal transduction histidine kinase (bacteriophytochrome)